MMSVIALKWVRRYVIKGYMHITTNTTKHQHTFHNNCANPRICTFGCIYNDT